MKDETYEGWTNRETWLVNLWVMNDEATYYMSQNADLSTAQKCKKFVLEDIPKSIYMSLLEDIGTKYLPGANINWDEICEAWNEE